MKLEKRKKEKSESEFAGRRSGFHPSIVKFRSHKAELNIQLPEEPVYIYADGTQIQQVILNFVCERNSVY